MRVFIEIQDHASLPPSYCIDLAVNRCYKQ